MAYKYSDLVGAGLVQNVRSSAQCCSFCVAEQACMAYTWESDRTGCWLRGGEFLQKVVIPGMHSAFMDDRLIQARLEPHDEPSQAPPSTHFQTRAPSTMQLQTRAATTVRPTTAGPSTATGSCSPPGEGCLETRCCSAPGTRCFTKNKYWAQCMEDCVPGPNPLDQVSPLPWECEALGPRAPGRVESCADAGMDCSRSKCCKVGGTLCFEKNDTWAACRSSCEAGRHLTSDDGSPWTCKALGPIAEKPAPWVSLKCARAGADCAATACCAEPGMQCYRRDPFHSECRSLCTPGMMLGSPRMLIAGRSGSVRVHWSCDPIGPRTPQVAVDGGEHGRVKKGTVGAWVATTCSGSYEDCSTTQCCYGVNSQCYRRDDTWSECKAACNSSEAAKDHKGTKSVWSCEEIGPRGWGLTLKGYPSLYCLTLFMPSSYEKGLIQTQINENAGIFQCDGYDLFSAEPITLGPSRDGTRVAAVLIPKIKVGMSQDGTAGNAKLFMAVWDKVIAGGRFRYYDWTIKVDPDAVLLAWSLREHMLKHTGKTVYVVNCNKFPDSPNFPMMYGSVEIFSQQAMLKYAKSSWECGSKLPWEKWGEDYYMTHCLDYINVSRVGDYTVIADDTCTGATCEEDGVAAFHPFKTQQSWLQCWSVATRRSPAPQQ